MIFPKEFDLTIEKEDFIDAFYINIDNCPIARALKRHFQTDHILVGGDYAAIHTGERDANDHLIFLQKYALPGNNCKLINETIQNPQQIIIKLTAL